MTDKSGGSVHGTEHTECAICGYQPDPDRVPPHYVLSLSDVENDDEYVQSYPFGGSLFVPFACSDECWLDAQDNPELIADGGTDASGTERREHLVYDGICPVCGEEFIDGYDKLEEGESYNARICVDEIGEEGEGKMLVHLENVEDDEQTPQEKWEAHNESFNYQPPQKPPEAWSFEEYQELHDRVISRRTQWFCDRCSGRGPMGSLRKARRHVESQHGPELVERYAPDEDDLEPATDGGMSGERTEERAEQNHGLGDFEGESP